MPYFNGTGPSGFGPGTGRGRGKCRTGAPKRLRIRQLSGGRHGWFSGLAVSLVAMVIRDVMNPSGLLRGTLRRLRRDRQPETIAASGREAYYTVADNHGEVMEVNRTNHQ